MKKKTKYKLESILKPIAPNVDPNLITILSVLITALAAYLIFKNYLFIGALVFVIGALFDALDGVAARKYKRATDFGAFLDRCADRINDALVLMAVILTGQVQLLLGLATLVAVIFASYTSATIEVIAKNRVGETMSLRPLRSVIIFLSLVLASADVTYLESMMVVLFAISSFSILERFKKASKILKGRKSR